MQAVAACSNAGDCVSIVLGITKPAPLWNNTAPVPGMLGSLLVGSGNPLTPCARMHSATASICFMVAADAGGPDPGAPPGNSLAQAFWAAWNAGDAGLIPELLLMLMRTPPPDEVGSGKCDTPWARMHDENLIPADARFEALWLALLGLLEDPQPAITSTPEATANATGTQWRARWKRADIPARSTGLKVTAR